MPMSVFIGSMQEISTSLSRFSNPLSRTLPLS